MSEQPEEPSYERELEEMVRAFQKDQAAVSQSRSEYEPALISASCSTGPDGAHMQGWLTYPKAGAIHFELTGKVDHSGLFAGGGGFTVPALAPGLLQGTGQFLAAGSFTSGTLQLWLADGRAVIAIPMPLVGVGPPLFNWMIQGQMVFNRG